ncbi:MAG: acyltransferase family protein [Pseudomonadota bacterium]
MPRRQIHIDAAKVLASHLIVLHHFTVYGPLAEALDLAVPRLADWFFGYARMAVQVFLVIGGYLAAGTLAPHGYLQRSGPWRSIAQRYVRLALPFAAALLLVIACSALARLWLDADFIPAAPSLVALLAHFVLLFDIFDYESLSVGVWYVAIDFQLFAVMAILLWIGGRAAQWLIALAMLGSLFVFNLHEAVDSWALYFFGSYAMGAFAWWAGHARHAGKWLALLAGIGIAALLWDFRLRIALALLVAMGLGVARWRLSHDAQASVLHPVVSNLLRVMSRSSYALFLTHFSIVLLANVVWAQGAWAFTGAALWVTAGAWVACVAISLLFERFVERPLSAIRIPV